MPEGVIVVAEGGCVDEVFSRISRLVVDLHGNIALDRSSQR